MYWQRRTDTAMGCPAIGRRELEHSQRMHRDKIRSIKSAIDTRPPAAQPHLTLYGRDYVAKKRATTEAAFSDLKMIQSIARTMTRSIDIPERKGPISLTASSRKAEIFNVMRENHRLLNSLENLQPVTRTVDFERENEWRQRYVINCSHSKRLSGEYDRQIERIHVEDQAKMKKYHETVERKRGANRMAHTGGNSASMPSLTPMGSVDQTDQMSSSAPAATQASPPQRQNRGKVGPGKASSSSSAARGVQRESNQPAGAKASVSFDAPDDVGEGTSGKTYPSSPYPNKSMSIAEQARQGNDDHELLVVDDKICVVMQPDTAEGQAKPADAAAPPEEEDEWAAALMASAEEEEVPPKAPPEEESSVAKAAPPPADKEEFDPSSKTEAKDESGYDDGYEEDFADESMNTTSKSKSATVEEDVFEEEEEFEKSATEQS